MKSDSASKIFILPLLLGQLNKWRTSGNTIVFTNGVFDILHCGHLKTFEFAALHGDRLVVGVNTDKSARSLEKGDGRPFNGEKDRALLIAGLASVDAVILFDQSTPMELISSIKPDVLVKGMDYEINNIVGREYAGRVERTPLLSGYSTTGLVHKIYQTLKNTDV